MIGDMFKHDFMIKNSISDTFELIKLVSPGSDQLLLNTLRAQSALDNRTRAIIKSCRDDEASLTGEENRCSR